MTFFKELDEAIGIMEDFVSKTPNARPLKDFDLVYEGDFTKWLKFANSLKLRLAMRVVYVDENLARTKAAEAVKSGVMTSCGRTEQMLEIGRGYDCLQPAEKNLG